VNLVEPPVPRLKPPARLGLDTSLRLRPWSVSRLGAIFREASRTPTAESLREARHARHCLSAFWLAAPVDLLPELYGGGLGALQRSLLEGPLPMQELAEDERQWRDQLSRQLVQQAEAPQRVNVLLALMAYLPPGQACVAEALMQVPDWLLHDYASYCDPELKARLQQPVGYLRPSAAEEAEPDEALETLPPLSERRGQEAMAWFEEPAVVNRMAALINLYGLDPADGDTREELAGLRDTIAQLWLDVSPEQLEALFRTPVGAVTRSLIVSGFAGELVAEQDLQTRRWLATQVEDLSQPRAVNALLAALLYFPPGKVSFDGGQAFIPAWLQQELQAL
jgi:hypothetical protein